VCRTDDEIGGRTKPKAIAYGLIAVGAFLAAVAAVMGLMVLWIRLCDKIISAGHPALAMALSPIAFIVYLLLGFIFLEAGK